MSNDNYPEGVERFNPSFMGEENDVEPLEADDFSGAGEVGEDR